jgi:hypothetical protein
MRWGGYGVDPKGTADWVLAIGKLILNFGAIESQTYLWLAQLHGQVPLPAGDVTMMFGRRVDRILELTAIESRASAHQAAVVPAWGRARALSQFRNQIAHDPLVFGWHGEETGPPDFLTIFDFQRGNQPSADDPSISLAQIHAKVDEVVAAAKEAPLAYGASRPSGLTSADPAKGRY